ncbi:MAG: Hsp20/alpha crystallin family protein [Acidobacteriota bacterium]
MVRKITPVSRIIKINTEISRIKKAPVARRERLPEWDETWVPRVDVCEKPGEVIVEAELPGVAEADIVITVQSSRVEIKGTKMERVSPEKITYLRLEREFGGFRRLVALPSTVVPDKARAFLANGVLTLYLKKYLTSEERRRLIESGTEEE